MTPDDLGVRRSIPARGHRQLLGYQAGTIVTLVDADADLWHLSRTPKRWRIVDDDGIVKYADTAAQCIDLAEAAGAIFPLWPDDAPAG